MNSKNFYITTPIFYPNDKLHLGHAYAMTVTDIIARYKNSKGYKIYFQTGSDDHGEKIEKKAQELKTTPQKLVDQNVELFKELWGNLGVSYDHFYRTSSPTHKKKVQKIFKSLLDKGDIYLESYKGDYCVACEDYTKSKICPSCNSSTKLLEEPAYFLKVSKYYQELKEFYQKNPGFLIPLAAKKELFANFLNDNIQDLCITRNSIEWGITVPNNPKMVIYVWFEALCNYLNSENGEKMFADNSTEIVHIIGKEIVRFHALYWPTILLALGKRLPNKVIAHGWLLVKGDKMSKSKGNIVNPLELLKTYPKDLLRAYFLAKVSFLEDGIFNEELLKEFYQDFFVNSLGNLCQRVRKMIKLYNGGIVPSFKEAWLGADSTVQLNTSELDKSSTSKDSSFSQNPHLKKYHHFCLEIIDNYQNKMDNYQLSGAFQEIEKLVNISNKLIQELEPWKLFKEKHFHLLNMTLNCLINGIKIAVFLLFPVAPESSQVIFEYLSLKNMTLNWQNIKDFECISGIELTGSEKIIFVANI